MPTRSELAREQWRASLRLNQLTTRQLAMILREAAGEAESMARRIASVSGVAARTRSAQLEIAAQGSREIARSLWNSADETIRRGIGDSSKLAVEHAIAIDADLGLPAGLIEGLTAGLDQNAERKAQAIMAHRRYGHTLSERVWKNQALASDRIHRIIDKGLAKGLSARELSKEVRGLVDPSTPGGVSHAAMRLARSEINNAYHMASKEERESRPWVERVEWRLSNSHPRPDICNDLRDAGPYLPREVPEKPHPHCLCYTAPVTPSKRDFQRGLESGQYDQWLASRGLEPMLARAG